MDNQRDRLEREFEALSPEDREAVERDVRRFIEEHYEELTDAIPNLLDSHERIIMDLYKGSFGPRYRVSQIAKLLHIAEDEVFQSMRTASIKFESLIDRLHATSLKG